MKAILQANAPPLTSPLHAAARRAYERVREMPAYKLWHRVKYSKLFLKARYEWRRQILNSLSRRKYEAQAPALSAAQKRILRDLSEKGIAFARFSELFNEECWENLKQMAEEFAVSESVEERRGALRGRVRQDFEKAYLVKRYTDGQMHNLREPLLQLALDSQMLDVVNSYLSLWAKLNYLDLWYTIPLAGQTPPVDSQNWHRDPEDRNLVKVFLYLSDVPETAGPLEYVPGSAAGAAHARLWERGNPIGSVYPPAEELERLFPPARRVSCAGPQGTLVFCDTSGFHRGGHATKDARLLATWAFVSPASFFKPRFKIEREPGRAELSAELSDAARFALR